MTSYDYIIMIIVDSCMIWFHFDCIITVGDRTVVLNIIARCSTTQTPTGQWNIDNVAD